MARNTFTEGRLEAYERMMQSVPRQIKNYAPKKQVYKKESLKKAHTTKR